MRSFAHYKYDCIYWLGGILANVELNRVSPVQVGQETFYAKRRLWFGRVLICAGNIYLRMLGAHARVLGDSEWHTRESEIYRVVYDVETKTDARGQLLVPEFPGELLAAYLESSRNTDKLRALELAAEALSRLHRIVVCWPDGRERPLSHGDATVQNVLIDSRGSHASWFDFEIAHDSSREAWWRHADDLRAFIYSAATRFDGETFPTLTRTIVDAYDNVAGLEALVEAVLYWRTRPISFHLAQAGIGYRKRQLLEKALLDSLRHYSADRV